MTINQILFQEEATVTATLVPEHERLSFLPKFFGEKYMIRAESLVYNWMRILCEEYNGGCWHFYTLSNGGCYMALATNNTMRIYVDGNGFSGEMSADAAGIIASLFMLSSLAEINMEDKTIDLYYLLRDFASEHPEGGLIFRAID